MDCHAHPPSAAGVAHGAFDNELDALAGMRELLSFLPLSNRETAPRVGVRACGGLLLLGVLQGGVVVVVVVVQGFNLCGLPWSQSLTNARAPWP